MLERCGGVCRDSDNRWLFGFSRNIGSTNVLWVELWAIFSVISLAWDRNLRRVIIESNSLVVVNLIYGGCFILHPYASLVNQIRAWLHREWEVTCVHVRREANQVADCLAEMTLELPFGLHLLELCPPRCSSLLLSDVAGVSFSCLVPA